MLKKLKHKLVAIIMVLVGTVIIGVLAISMATAQSSYVELTRSSLQKSLDERDYGPKDGQDDTFSSGHVGVVWADFTSAGVLIGTNQDVVSIDADAYEAAISEALASEESEGSIAEHHVMWMKATSPIGCRIVVADTSNIEATFNKQLIKTIGLGVIALLLLYALSNLLAGWALKPVEEAWQQQHQFVADASHELKTPLAVILANMQILKKDEGNIPDEDTRWINSSADEARRMRNLVEELLELARTEESSGTTRKNEDVDLSDIVEGEAIQFDAVAYEHSCTIEPNVEENIHVMGDTDQLERLTKTLVDNACKYATTGSTIEVELKRHNNTATLKVTNQGTPIDEDDLKHVFDRFYRSDKARARETGGFGLGLAIARGIAESHQGKIWATSSAEAGTSFYVKLPLFSQKA